MPTRNTVAYSRMPLAQPMAPASASSCGVPTKWLSESMAGSQQPVRLALLQERLHAFPALVADADVRDGLRRPVDEAGRQLVAGHVVQQLLARLHGGGAVLHQHSGELVHLSVQ